MSVDSNSSQHKLRGYKKLIREFLVNYSTPRLRETLEFMQAEKWSFYSCCCFIGAATADHALMGENAEWNIVPHYKKAGLLPNGKMAEEAANYLGFGRSGESFGVSRAQSNEVRRRQLIPIFKAELQKRLACERLATLRLEEREGVTGDGVRSNGIDQNCT